MPDTILLVDDERSFRPGIADGYEVTVARTSAEALKVLRSASTPFVQVWLDHDLGGEDTAMPVARFLSEHPELCDGEVIIHSANQVGAANLRSCILGILPVRSVSVRRFLYVSER